MKCISKSIEINGKNIFYTLINPDFLSETKPCLVFLHEGLGSVAQWKEFPEIISTETTCAALVYDRCGYGASSAGNDNFENDFIYSEAYEMLPELIEKLKITQKLLLIGHSDGGSIALMFASKYPNKTLAVVTEADHVICEDITLQGVKNIVEEYKKGPLKKWLSRFHSEKTDTMFSTWSSYWLSKEGKNWNLITEISEIHCPVLIIQGKNDCYGSVKQIIEKLKHIKGQTETLFIPDCGHIPHFEAKNKVIIAIKSFILNLI